jgi:hypothetical protein
LEGQPFAEAPFQGQSQRVVGTGAYVTFVVNRAERISARIKLVQRPDAIAPCSIQGDRFGAQVYGAGKRGANRGFQGIVRRRGNWRGVRAPRSNPRSLHISRGGLLAASREDGRLPSGRQLVPKDPELAAHRLGSADRGSRSIPETCRSQVRRSNRRSVRRRGRCRSPSERQSFRAKHSAPKPAPLSDQSSCSWGCTGLDS